MVLFVVVATVQMTPIIYNPGCFTVKLLKQMKYRDPNLTTLLKSSIRWPSSTQRPKMTSSHWRRLCAIHKNLIYLFQWRRKLGPRKMTTNGEFHILEDDHWTWTPISAYIGNFAVPLSTYVLTETHIKGVCSTRSVKGLIIWISFILKVIIFEDISVPQKS